ncbi:hypothetical protein [Salinicoccus halodurans]|uniref:Prolipoprotein diacylglyceryl transferase n=1 Tax=Salinicoccus halodurans TaxID=407035 RepID=A0A0F7HHE5_9STAP|nr:hypothetical protein [Salinicoccus halodurans]AKG72914.1 hypothetical protein AAT16_00960 [Salinicoccus halodurans]SFK76062.1 hypothetical protein SAMN05216235_1562 [Salinicoccus halodurans]
MLESFTIGSFEISSLYIAFAAAFLVSYLMIWNSEEKKHLFSHWLNAVIILFLIYKLSYIIFNWNVFTGSPLNVLYYDGGQQGLLAGLIVMFIYMIYRSNSLFYAEAYSIFSVAFITLYGVLELRVITQPPYIIMAVVSLVALIAIYFMWHRFRAIAVIFIILFVTQLIVRFFIFNGETILSLSLMQWWISGSIVYVLLTTEKGMRDENGPQLP